MKTAYLFASIYSMPEPNIKESGERLRDMVDNELSTFESYLQSNIDQIPAWELYGKTYGKVRELSGHYNQALRDKDKETLKIARCASKKFAEMFLFIENHPLRKKPGIQPNKAQLREDLAPYISSIQNYIEERSEKLLQATLSRKGKAARHFIAATKGNLSEKIVKLYKFLEGKYDPDIILALMNEIWTSNLKRLKKNQTTVCKRGRLRPCIVKNTAPKPEELPYPNKLLQPKLPTPLPGPMSINTGSVPPFLVPPVLRECPMFVGFCKVTPDQPEQLRMYLMPE